MASHQKLSLLEEKQLQLAETKVHWWPSLFVCCLAVPFVFTIGSLWMTPNRVFLLMIFLPAFNGWLFGKAGQKRSSDYFFIVFTLWCQLALVVADGFNESLEAIGMFAIETLGAYFLGRTFVRTKHQFRAVCRTFLTILMVLLPFGVLEGILNRPVLLELCGKVWKTLTPVFVDRPGRLGLRRAQTAFEHPILYGIFSSYGYGLCGIALEKGKIGLKGILRGVPSIANTFFSLSTGAFLAVGTQIILTVWERLTRTLASRWKVLFALVVTAFVTVDMLSNRTPFEVFISYLTFDQASSYNRVLIWRFGSEQVWRTPYFGIGHTGDWIRPYWMKPSMDNFWLVLAVRHGIMGFVFMALAIFLLLRDILKSKISDPEVSNMRLGWMFVMVSIFIAVCSVHLWGATYVLFMFMLGAGAWFADADKEESRVVAGQGDVDISRGVGGEKKLNFRPAQRSDRHNRNGRDSQNAAKSKNA